MSLEVHLAGLLEQVHPLEPLDITITEAIGCQIVGDVSAPRPIPHFARAALRGYAARAADLTGSAMLKVVDDVAPGFAATQPVYAGVVVRVAAGTPLPTGADCVVRGPGFDKVGDQITITEQAEPGAGVTAVGAVAAEGDTVLADGVVIDPVTVGLLAQLGVIRVSVRPHPRVVVVTIGNELLPVGAEPTAGLVYDATGPMLAAAAERAGAVAFRVGPVGYDAREIGQAIDDQLIRADLVVVAGEIAYADSLVRTQLAALGSVTFDEGSTDQGAFGHGTVGEDSIPVLALPSEPVAAEVLFAALAVPMIYAMRGVQPAAPVHVRLGADVPRTPATQLIPARLDADGTAHPQLGATLVQLGSADVLLRVLPGNDSQPAGSTVPALSLRPGSP